MKHVRVTLTANGREAEVHPMYDLLANAPFVERASALQWNFTGDAFGILHYIEGDINAFSAAIAEIEQVAEYELEPAGEGIFYAFVLDTTTGPLRELLAPSLQSGFIVAPPLIYHEDGHVSFSVFGPSDVLQAAFENLQPPIEAYTERVDGLRGGLPAIGVHLSARQREAIEVGLERGYYDTPREAGQAEIATTMGCAPSTAAEHLQKAEAKLVRAVLQQG